MPALYLLALAAFLSVLLTGLVTHYARRIGLLDHPGERSSHLDPTPRGGGAGWVLAFLISLGIYLLTVDAARDSVAGSAAMIGGLVVLAALGWWDDHHDLSARLRLLVQFLVGGLFIASLVSPDWIPSWSMATLGLLFLVWMINLYNFMDGSNGMAAAQGVFGFVLSAWLLAPGSQSAAVVCLMMAGACAGFLPWNLGKARVFMGDVGSLALGFMQGGILVYGVADGLISVPVALLVPAVFLADATLTLVLRVMKGERWYNAHRQHLYQRLIASGWTHARVLLVYQAVNLLVVVPGILIGVKNPEWAWPTVLAVGSVLGLGWYLSIIKIGVLAHAR
jgi:UDP-N-acetylmuramyl pentapeptide phosphotransferase/UDP-N-acetylglucosamine-1-phosphate transferase